MTKNIQLITNNKAKCFGCEACVQICKKECIQMVEDSEGFYYPSINTELCVECGQCLKVCPSINANKKQKESIQTANLMFNKNTNKRLNSSSGGVFIALAEYVIEQGGEVCGAKWEGLFSVKHTLVKRKEDIVDLMGSKYLQSHTNSTFPLIENALKSGKIILFSGTACQVEGLLRFLGKNYENLFTVDVMCHGVPSYSVWRAHIMSLEEKQDGRVERVYFRDKSIGWENYCVRYVFHEGKSVTIPHNEDPFIRLFLSNICLRPSCHICKYKSFPRKADLSIGDAWEVNRVIPQFNDGNGVSVVFINSEKGKELIERVSNSFEIRHVKADTIVPPMSDSRKPVKKHPNRKSFFLHLNSNADIEILLNDTNRNSIQKLIYYSQRSRLYLYRLLNK